MPRTADQEAYYQAFKKIAGLLSAKDRILEDVQRVISNIDHWENTVANITANINTLPVELQGPIGDLFSGTLTTDTLADMASAKTAMATYRDKHQGA